MPRYQVYKGILHPSSNAGRYQVGDDRDAPDISSGNRVAIYIAGRWIDGNVEHMQCYRIDDERRTARGYYFIAGEDGAICGLCTGMKVRLRL